MFRNLEQAWADLERGMMGRDSKALIDYAKELFYLGAYSSLTISSCISRFTEDDEEAIAQLQDLKKECVAFFGDREPLIVEFPEVDPKDQFQ